MKRLLILMVFTISIGFLYAQAPAWEWAKRAGGFGYDYGRAVATDNMGNQYVSGYFQNTVSFGPFTLTSSGNHDIYAAKMDINGNWLWARRCGGSGDDYGRGITVDAAGNVYVTGYFQNTANFGTINLISAGSYDICVAKIDIYGNWLWAKRAGGTASDWGYGIKTDAASNVYLTGHFQGTATFGESILISSGGYDAFVTKLDNNGIWMWASKAGGTGGDFGFGLALDAANNILITGHFTGSMALGTIVLNSYGLNDAFVAKLDNSGAWLWAQKAGGTGEDYGFAIDVDISSHVYITGRFSGSATFGSLILNSSGGYDIFTVKLGSAGGFIWARKAGGSGEDRANSIDIDIASNVYVAGFFSGTSTFGNTTLISSGSSDICAFKLDYNGNYNWAMKAGGSGTDQSFGIAADMFANVYLTGSFWNTAMFGTTSLTSSGSEDIFVAKLHGLDYPLPVELSSFTSLETTDGVVRIDWSTESETNLTGYYLLRNTENEVSTAIKIPDMIEATNTSMFQHYTFYDRDVECGITYYYWLECVDFNNSSTIHGPIYITLTGGEIPITYPVSELFTAYPNPFRSGESALIKVHIAENSYGVLTLYNLRGQLVRTYKLGSGEHNVNLDGKRLEAGVYFYMLQTELMKTVKKLVLLK